jgi:hypothetical protein
MPKPDYSAILRDLVKHNVDFIVVGGVSAVLQGAPIMTFDLDIVHATDEENIERLEGALDSMDAWYRMQPERRLKPQKSHLASAGHRLLMTQYGPLDVLGTIGHGHSYRELIQHTCVVEIMDQVTVRVLELGKLIDIKEETNGEKDRAVLPILRQTLRERG